MCYLLQDGEGFYLFLFPLMGVRERLLCVGAQADEETKETIASFQNPLKQKRGGLGFGAHGTIREIYGQGSHEHKGPARRTNIHLFGTTAYNSDLSLHMVDEERGKFMIRQTGTDVAEGTLFKVPEWYNQQLSSGRKVYEILQLHMGHELVGIIGATKCKLLEMGNMCSFCSMKGGKENTNRSMEDIIQALRIIDDHTGIYNNIALSTSLFDEAGFNEAISGVGKMKKMFPKKKIAFECQPLSIGQLYRAKMAGVDTLMMPLDCVGEEAQDRIIPGKKDLIQNLLWTNAAYAVELFGRGNVVSNVIIGPYESVAMSKGGIRRLIDVGIYPDPIPVRIFDKHIFTKPEDLIEVTRFQQEYLENSGFRAAMGDITSGCAACGGCSLGISGSHKV